MQVTWRQAERSLIFQSLCHTYVTVATLGECLMNDDTQTSLPTMQSTSPLHIFLSRRHCTRCCCCWCDVLLAGYVVNYILRRPTLSSAYLGFTAILSSIFRHSFHLPFFVRQLLSELAEWNSTKTGHTFGSECDLKMHVRNLGHSFPLKIGSENQTTYFRRLRNLTANLTALSSEWNAIYTMGQVRWQLRRVSYRLKISQTLVHKRLKTGPGFLPTLRKFCVLLHFQA